MPRTPSATTDLPKACAAEAVGTFALVFAGAGAIMAAAGGGAAGRAAVAVTFGLVVMICVYLWGRISGAHINPAVTLALAAAGLFPWRRVGPYVAAQSAGAIAAALALRAAVGPVAGVGATVPTVGAWPSVGLEVVLTVVLMVAVLAVVTGPAPIGRFSGLVIGAVVGLEAWWAGPLTGASMNPARSLGPAVASGDVRLLWIYVVGPVIGALLASLAWQALTGRPVLSGLRRALGSLRARNGQAVVPPAPRT